MRWTAIILSIFFVSSSLAATESQSFEKSFQKFGKKLDHTKAKAKEIGQEAKQEFQALKAKGEEAGEKALEESKEARTDWKKRFKGAFTELGSGIKSAWRKLTGDE